jgi:competence protein ComEA
MLQKLKKWFSPFFTLSKSEQRGIVLFSFLILCVLAFRLIMPLLIDEKPVDNSQFLKEIESFYKVQQQLSDSIQIERLQNRGELDRELATKKLKPFMFNPNNLPEEKWIQLGLTPKQVKSIKNYEAKGGKFRSKADVKKMYAISDVEYQILEPYILIPEEEKPEKVVTQKVESNKTSKKTYLEKKTPQTVEINSADSAMLADQLLLSPWLSGRVVKYRNLLGGYYTAEQLSEVYGFKPYILQKTLPFVQVDTLLITKIDLNTATFKEILHHPYISYEMTKDIVNTRDRKGKYKSVNELVELHILPDTVFIKLRPYLIINE